MVTFPGSPPHAAMLSLTQHDVEHAGLARRRMAAELGEREVSEHVEAVVDADRHHVAAQSEGLAVVHRRAARAGRKPAAMQPDHHRPLAGQAGGPDVYEQAVLVGAGLARRRWIAGALAAGRAAGLDPDLDRRCGEAQRVGRLAPGRRPLRRGEPKLADRRGAITQALEDLKAVVAVAADGAVGRRNDFGAFEIAHRFKRVGHMIISQYLAAASDGRLEMSGLKASDIPPP
jgi:hypothetical protein